MELKSRSFTSKEPHVAREPQVADPCPIPRLHLVVQIRTYGDRVIEDETTRRLHNDLKCWFLY
jgi:hypothetical protein